MSITIPVDIHDAFSHLFIIGLASIVEEENPGVYCTLHWDLDSATISTTTPMGIEDFAKSVLSHARKYSQLRAMTSEGVYTADNSKKTSETHATMSPRLSGLAEPDGWRRLQNDRKQAIDELNTLGESRYFGALGQPAYWSGRRSGQSHDLNADSGATRWEMVARNRGQEFVKGRLHPLAAVVAGFSSKRIVKGLDGSEIHDELAKDKSDSRTATGLHAPAATDNARAWCALMGVAAFPVIPSVSDERDSTAGFFQRRGSNAKAILPVFADDWTLARYRSVVRSAQLLEVGIAATTQSDVRSDWLSERGVATCVVFNQFVSDNKSAPERWLERGKIVPIKGSR